MERLAVEPPQLKRDGYRWAGERDVQPGNLGGEEVFPDLDVLVGTACVRGDEDVDERLRGWHLVLGGHCGNHGDVGQSAREAVAGYLDVADRLEAAGDVMVPRDDGRWGASSHSRILPAASARSAPPRSSRSQICWIGSAR